MKRPESTKDWRRRFAKEWLILIACIAVMWGYVGILILNGRLQAENLLVTHILIAGAGIYGVVIFLRSIVWACRILAKRSSAKAKTPKEGSQFSVN